MKGKPLHALKFFLHLACKAKQKRLCASCSMHKNVKVINTTKYLPEIVEYSTNLVSVRGTNLVVDQGRTQGEG